MTERFWPQREPRCDRHAANFRANRLNLAGVQHRPDLESERPDSLRGRLSSRARLVAAEGREPSEYRRSRDSAMSKPASHDRPAGEPEPRYATELGARVIREQDEWRNFVLENLGANAHLLYVGSADNDRRVYRVGDRMAKVQRLSGSQAPPWSTARV